MKVVIDTNVMVSASFGGNPQKVIDLLERKEFTLCISEPIVGEYVEVFQRFKNPKFSIEKLLLYCERAEAVSLAEATITLHVVEKDPDDNKFIECAVELNADYIVTGDKALLEVSKYHNTLIVTPKHFVDLFSH